MTHKLGLHWIREHPDREDLPHVERMQYRSVKLFGNAWSNADFCHELLAVLPKDAYILARDHPLSEQKEDLWRDPIGTGRRHADEWADKVRTGRYHMPTDRTFFLGINEPDATAGDRAAIDRYTVAFLDRLQAHGLRGGAFNFSTGHPRTVDGTEYSAPDYTVFEDSHQAIVRGHHIGVAHIYGTAAVPLAPGHYDRLRACPWQDVQWVIGEFGIDEHVIGGGPHYGYQVPYAGQLENYVGWLDGAILGINDPRIHSYQVFTYDFSKPWDTFDIHPIRRALESMTWAHAASVPDNTVHIPVVVKPPDSAPPAQPSILDPNVLMAILDIESGAAFGEGGRLVVRFEAHIFKAQLANDDLFSRHFKIAPSQPWAQPQYYRAVEAAPWAEIHTGQQASEWDALNVAQRLNDTAALRSTSMGRPQIMGFNAGRVGYVSARAMFDAFARRADGEAAQVIAFLNYMLSDAELVRAVKERDWRTIARAYNGAGGVDVYAPRLEAAYKKRKSPG